MARIRCNITPKDIKDGIQGLCTLCPGARSVSRRLKDNYFPLIGAYSIQIKEEGTRRVVYNELSLPDRLQRFIAEFDSLPVGMKNTIRPCSFTIDIPDEFLK